jgi:hypothetical protein
MAMLELLTYKPIQIKLTQSITQLWIVRFVMVRNTHSGNEIRFYQVKKASFFIFLNSSLENP